jgi:two-component system KDP operon response regulator KdpE
MKPETNIEPVHYRVLVVDDQPKVLRFIEIGLNLRGFEVITETSGRGALEIMKSREPDVMLLDILMPEMDGFEVLRQLRKFSGIPVIAFSADPANRNEALENGASDFVSKPFKPDSVAARIRAVLEN